MQKRGFSWCLVLLGVLILQFSLSLGEVLAQSSDLKVDLRVSHELNNQTETQVIIIVNDSYKENPSWFHAWKIHATPEPVVDQVMDTLPSEDILNTYTNAFIANISLVDLKELINEPRVLRIEAIKHYSLLLQNTIPLINASQTFSLQVSSINMTGVGQTICIIDSGVNYSHPDLGGCYGNNNASSSCKVIGGWDYIHNDPDPMDDHGHGTHVSGIASAKGNITGVAPDAKLVMMKVCDSSGSCANSDIRSAIDWCVANASQFNISVISMSLGANCNARPEDCSLSYCNSDFLASSINNAVGNNISVVISSGNDGSTSLISAPACIQNATSIGASSKADAMASYTNRNVFLDLLAPGGVSTSTATRINSTCITSGYCSDYGTSMASPHVAGTIALMREYLRSTNTYRTPSQVESILNATGKQIIDSVSGLTFSRVNVLQSILALDTTPPFVQLKSPLNASFSTSKNVTLICNATDLLLSNGTIYIWNDSAVVNATPFNVNKSSSVVNTTFYNLAYAPYSWNCQFIDKESNSAFASTNSTFTLVQMSVNLSSPISGFSTKVNSTFTCNATSSEIFTNVTFYIWNVTGIVNETSKAISGMNNGSSIDYRFTKEDNYSWNCLFSSISGGNSFAITNASIRYDLTPPNILHFSPPNSSYLYAGKFNITLNENGTCNYTITNGISNKTLSSINNQYFEAINNSLIDYEQYNLSFYCEDDAGNKNASSPSLFYVKKSPPNLTLLSPNQGFSTEGASLITFSYLISDEINTSQCDLILNNQVVSTNTTIVNLSQTQNFYYTVSPGTYTWSVNCTDLAGNIGNGTQRSFSIQSTSSPSSGGSSSSSSGSSTPASLIPLKKQFHPTSQEIESGYTVNLSIGDRVEFELLPLIGSQESIQEHQLTLNYISDSSADILIQSSPTYRNISLGESLKVNLTSDKYFDLLISLKDIQSKKATLFIQAIYEPTTNPSDSANDKNPSQDSDQTIVYSPESNSISDINNKKSYGLLYILILAGSVLLLLAIIIFVLAHEGRKKHIVHHNAHKYRLEHHNQSISR